MDLLITSITESKHETNTIVQCRGILSGLSFYYSMDIFANNIAIKQCGARHWSSSKPIKGTNISPDLSAAVYFFRSRNIWFDNVHLHESLGYGLVLYDTGGMVFFHNMHVRFGGYVDYKDTHGNVVPGYASGGGVYIEYLWSKGYNNSNFTSNNVIVFSSCSVSLYLVWCTIL